MCGIVGYWNKQGANVSTVEQMALCIQHRGPDSAGTWLNKEGELAMAHRRLAVLEKACRLILPDPDTCKPSQ